MREIKFRVWLKNKKEMIYPNGYEYELVYGTSYTNKFHLVKLSDYSAKEIENIIIMQYTGLRDKNDKEIYEGDIVRFENGKLGKIVWSKKDVGFAVKRKVKPLFFNCDIDANNVEVVGNIFENPELLEQN